MPEIDGLRRKDFGSQFKWLQSTMTWFHCFWRCGEVRLMVQRVGWSRAALLLVAGKEEEILMRGRDREPWK